jgi:hypothetical protein
MDHGRHFVLAEMTSAQVRAELGRGRSTVVVPFGAVEQHGPHLPLDIDAVLADRLGPLLAERLDALWAPTTRMGRKAGGSSCSLTPRSGWRTRTPSATCPPSGSGFRLTFRSNALTMGDHSRSRPLRRVASLERGARHRRGRRVHQPSASSRKETTRRSYSSGCSWIARVWCASGRLQCSTGPRASAS